jgi:hypothetical protein
MKYKQKVEVLHEVSQKIYGKEPFLSFPRPRMIVNFSNGMYGSHNFFEGYFESMARLRPGSRLVFQINQVSLVPMTWYEQVWSWVKERVCSSI